MELALKQPAERRKASKPGRSLTVSTGGLDGVRMRCRQARIGVVTRKLAFRLLEMKGFYF